LCWPLSSSSSANARSDKRLSLLQVNVSSTLRVGWPACFLRPYYTNCVSFLKKRAECSFETSATQSTFIWFQHSKTVLLLLLLLLKEDERKS
jgi:hypothetical protein